MNILIGSRAFNFHYGITSSESTDWDIISSNKINNSLVDSFCINEESNKIIYELVNTTKNDIISSPFGDLIIAPKEILKVIYLSSLELKRQKYFDKLKIMRDIKLTPFLHDLLKMRIKETKERIDKQKFFTEEIPRIFNHDDLHSWIVKEPTYKKILKEGSFTIGSKEKFNELSLQNKLNLICEEIFVFSLERDLIPKVVYNKACLEFVVKDLFNPNNKLCPLYFWLDKFSVNNGVKRFPISISKFIRENKELIITESKLKWWNYLENLPESFWRELINNS